MEWLKEYWAVIGFILSSLWIAYKYLIEKKEKKSDIKRSKYVELIDVIYKYRFVLFNAFHLTIDELSSLALRLTNTKQELDQKDSEIIYLQDEFKKIVADCKNGDKNCIDCERIDKLYHQRVSEYNSIRENIEKVDKYALFRQIMNDITPFTSISSQVSGLHLFMSSKVSLLVKELELETTYLKLLIDNYYLNKSSEKDVYNKVGEILFKCETLIHQMRDESGLDVR